MRWFLDPHNYLRHYTDKETIGERELKENRTTKKNTRAGIVAQW